MAVSYTHLDVYKRQAVISFTGQGNGPYNNGGPAFYALDVEHTSQGPYAVGWPGMPKNSSGKIYNDFFEVDFMEYDVKEYSYQNGIGNWYGYPAATRSGTHNPYQAVSYTHLDVYKRQLPVQHALENPQPLLPAVSAR